MSRTLIDPVEAPKVDDKGVIQEAPQAVSSGAPAQDEIQTWATSKGFDPSMDRKFLEAYRNLEQDHGRMRNEVGDSRQLIDRVLQLEEGNRQSPPVEDVTLDPTELLTDPTGTLDKYFDRKFEQDRAEYESRISELESQVGQVSLTAAHSDAKTLVNDPNFVAYVQESPTRSRVAQAAVQGDVGALNDLLTEYKAGLQQTVDPGVQYADPGQAALLAAQAAQLEGSASSGGSSDSGKVYSRQALIRMKIEDPEAYGDPAFQEDIKRAYVEKRVR